jgi:hypothetical protein
MLNAEDKSTRSKYMSCELNTASSRAATTSCSWSEVLLLFLKPPCVFLILGTMHFAIPPYPPPETPIPPRGACEPVWRG